MKGGHFMSKMFRKNVPTYRFEFPTEEAATNFMNYACGLSTSAIIDHPNTSDGKCLSKQVSISGNNFIIMNLTFRSCLVEKAKELEGIEL